MVEGLVEFLQLHVLPFGALGVFLASVIEEVVAPIPSALVMTMSGFLLADSIFSLIFKVALPSALGVTIGSYFVYFLARFGGRLLIEKWGRYLGLYWSDIEKLKARLAGTKRDEILIGLARVLPIVPSVAISAFCGIFGMRPLKYFLITLPGVFLRGIILGLVGWQAGHLYTKYAHLVSSVENVVLLSTLLGIVVFLVVKFRGQRNGGPEKLN